jgi:hypothetical protein
VTGPMLVQHDLKPVVTSVTSSSAFSRTALPIALNVFVACYELFAVSDFADPASRYGLPVKVIGGVKSDPDHYTRFEEFYGCPDSNVLSFHDIRRLVHWARIRRHSNLQVCHSRINGDLLWPLPPSKNTHRSDRSRYQSSRQ